MKFDILQSKSIPWLEIDDKKFFNLTPDEISHAIDIRRRFDHNGLRFSGHEIRNRGWVVGFYPHDWEAVDSQFCMNQRFFDRLSGIGTQAIFEIPCEDEYFERTGNYIVDTFSPSLIAKGACTYDDYWRMRNTYIQMMNGSFFVFPLEEHAVVLETDANYSLIASTRDFVESVLGKTIEDSWSLEQIYDRIEPNVIPHLMQAMAAYGVNQ